MGDLFTSFDEAWQQFLERRSVVVKGTSEQLHAPPDELRSVLEPLRETFLGRQCVEESIRVSFPFFCERLFEPWTVQERLPVGR